MSERPNCGRNSPKVTLRRAHWQHPSGREEFPAAARSSTSSSVAQRTQMIRTPLVMLNVEGVQKFAALRYQA